MFCYVTFSIRTSLSPGYAKFCVIVLARPADESTHGGLCVLFLIYLFIITGLVQRRVSIYLHDLLTFKMFKNVSIAYRLRFLEMRSLGRLSMRCKENQEE